MDKEEKKKKTEQKDELMENDRCYPVEQVQYRWTHQEGSEGGGKRIESGPEQSGQ